MKNYDAGDIIKIIFAVTVALVLLSSIAGMIINNVAVNQYNANIRLQLIDLLKYITGAVIYGMATKKEKIE